MSFRTISPALRQSQRVRRGSYSASGKKRARLKRLVIVADKKSRQAYILLHVSHRSSYFQSKAVFRIEVHGEKDAGVDFAHASIADMPPRLRIVFEENKLMKEKLKKYKHKTMGMEAELLKRNNQVVALEDTIGTLKQQLQVRM